jgi:hypothetical protein
MSTSQILDRTFQLYRSNFVLFAGIAILPPAMILIAQLVGLSSGARVARMFRSPATIVTLVLGGAVLVVVYLVGTALATGATVHAVSRVHLGSPMTIMESYRAVRRLVLRIIEIIIVVFFMVVGAVLAGYLALVVLRLIIGGVGRSSAVIVISSAVLELAALVAAIVWGIRIYCRYSLAVPACVVEKLPAIICIRRSKLLTQKSLFPIFLIYLLLAILGAALGAALSIPNYIEFAITRSQPTLPFQVWSIIANFFAGTLAGPIGTIAISLVYYDQRVRREAFDLQLMMDAMGQPVLAQASSAPPVIG